MYNQKNAYFGVAVPVLTYIYVRNLSPTLRTRYLEPLHSLGKITLETYLMQHHVWLTSNAKTLLVLVPGHPKVNMVLLSVTYVLVSRELYRLTMSLRGMCLPDNLSACLRNLTGIAVALASSVGVAKALILVGAGPVTCGCVIAAIGFGAAFAVHRLLLLPSARDGGSSGGSIGGGCGGALSAAAVTGTGVGADLAVKNSPAERKYDGRLLHANHTVGIYLDQLDESIPDLVLFSVAFYFYLLLFCIFYFYLFYLGGSTTWGLIVRGCVSVCSIYWFVHNRAILRFRFK